MSVKLSWQDNSENESLYNIYRVDVDTDTKTLVDTVSGAQGFGRLEWIDKYNYQCGKMHYTVSAVLDSGIELDSAEIVKVDIPCEDRISICMRMDGDYLDSGPYENHPSATYNTFFDTTDAGKPALSASVEFRTDSVIDFDDTGSPFYNFSEGFTIECVIKPEKLNTRGAIIFSSTRDTGVANAPFNIEGGIIPSTEIPGANHLYISYTSKDLSQHTHVATLKSIELNQWQHVAWVSDGSKLSLYIDVELAGEFDIQSGGITSNSQGFRIGNSYNYTRPHSLYGYVGKMNDFRLLTGQSIDICKDWLTEDMCQPSLSDKEIATIITTMTPTPSVTPQPDCCPVDGVFHDVTAQMDGTFASGAVSVSGFTLNGRICVVPPEITLDRMSVDLLVQGSVIGTINTYTNWVNSKVYFYVTDVNHYLYKECLTGFVNPADGTCVLVSVPTPNKFHWRLCGDFGNELHDFSSSAAHAYPIETGQFGVDYFEGDAETTNTMDDLRSGPMTISAWFWSEIRSDAKKDTPQSPFPVNGVTFNNPDSDGYGISYNVYNNGMTGIARIGGVGNVYLPGLPEQWVHIVFSVDANNNYKVLFNGEVKASGVMQPLSQPAKSKILIGRHNYNLQYGTALKHKGRISDIGVWSKPLDSAHLKTIYQNGRYFCPTPTPTPTLTTTPEPTPSTTVTPTATPEPTPTPSYTATPTITPTSTVCATVYRPNEHIVSGVGTYFLPGRTRLNYLPGDPGGIHESAYDGDPDTHVWYSCATTNSEVNLYYLWNDQLYGNAVYIRMGLYMDSSKNFPNRANWRVYYKRSENDLWRDLYTLDNRYVEDEESLNLSLDVTPGDIHSVWIQMKHIGKGDPQMRINEVSFSDNQSCPNVTPTPTPSIRYEPVFNPDCDKVALVLQPTVDTIESVLDYSIYSHDVTTNFTFTPTVSAFTDPYTTERMFTPIYNNTGLNNSSLTIDIKESDVLKLSSRTMYCVETLLMFPSDLSSWAVGGEWFRTNPSGTGLSLSVDKTSISCRYTDSSEPFMTQSVNLIDDQWYHIAVTYEGGIMKMFLDGSLYTTAEVVQPQIDGDTIVVGGEFNGTINNTRVVVDSIPYEGTFKKLTAPHIKCCEESVTDVTDDDVQLQFGTMLPNTGQINPSTFVESTEGITVLRENWVQNERVPYQVAQQPYKNKAFSTELKMKLLSVPTGTDTQQIIDHGWDQLYLAINGERHENPGMVVGVDKESAQTVMSIDQVRSDLLNNWKHLSLTRPVDFDTRIWKTIGIKSTVDGRFTSSNGGFYLMGIPSKDVGIQLLEAMFQPHEEYDVETRRGSSRGPSAFCPCSQYDINDYTQRLIDIQVGPEILRQWNYVRRQVRWCYKCKHYDSVIRGTDKLVKVSDSAYKLGGWTLRYGQFPKNCGAWGKRVMNCGWIPGWTLRRESHLVLRQYDWKGRHGGVAHSHQYLPNPQGARVGSVNPVANAGPVKFYIDGKRLATIDTDATFSHSLLTIGSHGDRELFKNTTLHAQLKSVRSVIGANVYNCNFTPPEDLPDKCLEPIQPTNCDDISLLIRYHDLHDHVVGFDYSGNSQPVVTGDVTHSDGVNFQSNKSIFINNTQTHSNIKIPAHAKLNLQDDFTIEFNMQPGRFGTALDPEQKYSTTIFDGRDLQQTVETNNMHCFIHDLNQDGVDKSQYKITFRVDTPPEEDQLQQSIDLTSHAVDFDQPIHVAIAHRSGTCRLFVNGKIHAEKLLNIPLDHSASDIIIGQNKDPQYHNTTDFTGYIDSFRILNGYCVYTCDFTPPVDSFIICACPGKDLDCELVSLHVQSDSVSGDTVFGDYSDLSSTIVPTGTPIHVDNPGIFNTTSVQLLSGDRLTVNTREDSALSLSNNEFTIETWVFFHDSVTESNRIIYHNQNPTQTCSLHLNNQNQLQFVGGPITLTSNDTLDTNKWYHIAAVKDSTHTVLYIDGTAVAQYEGTLPGMSFTTNWTIGGASDDTGWMIGNLQDFRVCVSTSIYNCKFFPSQELLHTCNIPCVDEGTDPDCTQVHFHVRSNSYMGDPVVVDESFESHVIKTTGAPTNITDQASVGLGSLNFAGVLDSLVVPNFQLGSYTSGDTIRNMYHATEESTIVDFGSGDFTIEGWFRCTSEGYNTGSRLSQVLYSVGCPSPGSKDQPIHRGFQLERSDGKLLLHGSIDNTSSDMWSVISDDQMMLNQWHHIVVTRKNNTIRLLMDGKRQGDTLYMFDFSDLSQEQRVLSIGASTTNSIQDSKDRMYFTGQIDEFRISRGVSVYPCEYTVPSTPLLVCNPAEGRGCKTLTGDSTTVRFCFSGADGTLDASMYENQLVPGTYRLSYDTWRANGMSNEGYHGNYALISSATESWPQIQPSDSLTVAQNQDFSVELFIKDGVQWHHPNGREHPIMSWADASGDGIHVYFTQHELDWKLNLLIIKSGETEHLVSNTIPIYTGYNPQRYLLSRTDGRLRLYDRWQPQQLLIETTHTDAMDDTNIISIFKSRTHINDSWLSRNTTTHNEVWNIMITIDGNIMDCSFADKHRCTNCQAADTNLTDSSAKQYMCDVCKSLGVQFSDINSTLKSRVNSLVINGKNTGWWDKTKALYLPIWQNPITNRFNLNRSLKQYDLPTDWKFSGTNGEWVHDQGPYMYLDLPTGPVSSGNGLVFPFTSETLNLSGDDFSAGVYIKRTK